MENLRFIPMEPSPRSEEHTSELQSRRDLVCRLLLEKKKKKTKNNIKHLLHKILINPYSVIAITRLKLYFSLLSTTSIHRTMHTTHSKHLILITISH